jgi:hypothetical protein
MISKTLTTHQSQFDSIAICIRFLNILVIGKNEAGDPVIHWAHITLYSTVWKPSRTKMYLSDLKTQTLSASGIKTDKFMLYTEIITVCSEVHAKHKISEC